MNNQKRDSEMYQFQNRKATLYALSYFNIASSALLGGLALYLAIPELHEAHNHSSELFHPSPLLTFFSAYALKSSWIAHRNANEIDDSK